MSFLNDLRLLTRALNPLELTGLVALVATAEIAFVGMLEGLAHLDDRLGLSERLERWARVRRR